MDNYFEQSAIGERGPRERLKYGACWAGVVLLAMIAIFSALHIIGFDGESVVVNWFDVAVLLASAALAVLIFLMKERIYREYDYILWNSELEICVIYNRKRRKKAGTIQLGQVSAWGPAKLMEKQMHDARRRNWCARADAAWCLTYSGDGGKEAALLELSDEMCAQLRATGRAMRDCEVKA